MVAGSQDLLGILNFPTYSTNEASRLVGISRYRVRRYLHGYDHSYTVKDGVIKRHVGSVVKDGGTKKSSYASFLDLIDMLFVKRFLECGFTLQKIRRALDEARDYLGTPHFARSTFFTGGEHIILQLEQHESKEMIALLTGGQCAMTEIVEQFGDKIDFEDVTGFGLAQRWYPRGKKGLIVIDPRISYGRPTIVGRGVAAENIYNLYKGENEKIAPVSDWFKLPAQEIQAAVSFQSSLYA